VDIQDILKLVSVYPKLGNDNDEASPDEQPYELAPQDLETYALVLHSSGSTGMPKPIYQTYHFHLNIVHSRMS
jgi:acyl-coenzyme A synthetase/AMP-(fatty) acid ligase